MTDYESGRPSPSQLAGELLWRLATSERYELAWSRSEPYRAAERAFLACVRAEYDLGRVRAGEVRNLLAEYGPHDSLVGTSSRGIASYVQFVKDNPGRRF